MNWEKLKETKLFALAKQFVKFGIVGVANTLIQWAAYYPLVLFLNVHYIIANIVGFILSTLNSYYWNSKYVFPKKDQNRKSVIIRCFCAYGFTFLLSNALLGLMVDIIGISKMVAPIISLFITVPTNFALNKFWVYKEKRETETQAAK